MLEKSSSFISRRYIYSIILLKNKKKKIEAHSLLEY